MSGGLEIKDVIGRTIFDAWANPAIEAEVVLQNGARGRASVSLKDGAMAREETALIRGVLSKVILSEDASNQDCIDRLLLQALNHKKNRYTALVLSMAVSRAAGAGIGLPLYRYLGGTSSPIMPVPMMNMINSNTDKGMAFQEIMAVPQHIDSYSEALRMGVEIYHTLKRLLSINHYNTSNGKEGGLVIDLINEKEAFAYLIEASKLCGYQPGLDVLLAVNVNTDYLERYQKLADEYPVCTVMNGYRNALLITNDFTWENGTVIQMEEVGTVTGTLDAVKKARKLGHKIILSNNFGETEEPFIADMAVAVEAEFIKNGAPCQGGCTAKNNEFIRIEEFYNKER